MTGRDFSSKIGGVGSAVFGRVPFTAALAASLVLSLMPAFATQTDAAPPDATREKIPSSSEDGATNPDIGAHYFSATPPQPSLSGQLIDSKDQGDPVSIPSGQTNSSSSSVRPRGLEAPVQLQQQQGQGAEHEPAFEEENETTETSRDERRDPGDGPVRKRDEKSREQSRAAQGIRIWPMPADSYTFTQQFGCVQQLGNLYFPGEGCPAEAPVVHTGIDLAAPEGTLFYAAASGWVTLADYDRPTADANTRIIIQHDGRNERYATDYLHWIASYVDEGDYVEAGDPIGEVGSVGFSTGPHLHFSVTDLETGEHIDPLRWLPDEPGLEGYVSRRPTAELRLPAGTTAGQPESADPAPPPPPKREDVPKHPPGESGDRVRSERRGERHRDERTGHTGDESASNTSDRGRKKSSRDAGASDISAEDNSEKERDRTRDRERIRERDKDGSKKETDDSGDDGRSRADQEDSNKNDEHRDRRTDDDSANDSQNRGHDGERRDNRDSGRSDSSNSDSGGRDKRNGARHDQDDNSSGKDKGGDGRDRAKNASAEAETSGGNNTPDDAA